MGNDARLIELKATFLHAIANAQRLKVLQTLGHGEMAVGSLADIVGLSQSALSQHLAKLREHELVQTRRDAQTIYYSIKSPMVHQILDVLAAMFDEQQTVSLKLAG